MSPKAKSKSGPTDDLLALALEIADAKRCGDHARCKRLLARWTLPPPGIPPPILVSVASLRQSHDWTPKRVHQLIRDGEIEAVKHGSRTFVVMVSVDAFLARLKAEDCGPRRTPNPAARRRRAA